MLARLVLTDFRNHAALTLAPGPGFIALTGANGAGKTNILEAVSLLAPGRGLRRAALSAMARGDGPGGFGVAATLGDGIELATGTRGDAPERRLVRVQGAAEGTAALAERLSVVWLTPAMDRLFVEGPSERRRFLDRLTLALDPGHARHAQRYEAAMRARNRLLAESGEATWLAALEAQMGEHGAALATARADTVARLGGVLTTSDAAGFPRAALALEGWEGKAETLVADLAAARSRDAAAGRATVGPHRSDLVVAHLDKAQPAALASTGEQKALLLAIVLAHARIVAALRGAPPVLLLDEVAAHLDPDRRAALFDRLAGHGQVWMTGTEEALFAGLPDDATRIALG